MINQATMIQFFKFCCVGAVNVLVDFGVYYGLVFFLPIYAARTLSWLVACLFSYSINKRWIFKAKDTGLLPLLRFSLINLASLALGLILLYIFTFIGCSPVLAFIFSLPFTTLSNYLGYKLWTFKKV